MPIRNYTITSSRRFSVALLISALLHLIVLIKLDDLSQNSLGNKNILLVSILATIAEKTHDILPPTNIDKSTTQATPLSPTILPAENLQEFQDTTITTSDQTNTQSTLSRDSVEMPSYGTDATEQPIALPMPQPPANWVEIEYEIISNSTKLPSSGRTTQRYEADSLGHYRLQSSNANSTASWVLESEGLVTAEGLRPLPSQATGDDRPDFSSRLFYQFMFSPPGGPDNRLWGNDGTRLSGHTYRIIGIETLEVLSHGELRTVHLWLDPETPYPKKEVWLAVDYRYLPIRIRITDADSKVSEQIARSFSLE